MLGRRSKLRTFAHLRELAGAVALASLISGCSTHNGSLGLLTTEDTQALRTSFAKSIGSNPEEINRAFDTSQANEIMVANQATKRIVARSGTSDNQAMQVYLQTIADKLTRDHNSQSFQYRVFLLNAQQINAYTPGAGKILINEGLIAQCRTEGQAAAVLAHEIAHVMMSHPRRMRQIQVAAKVGDTFMDTITPKDAKNSLFDRFLRLTGKATLNSFLRGHEAQADSIAIDLMVEAGYDPKQMIAVQQILARYVPQMARLENNIYGNHPLSEDREDAVRQKIERYYPHTAGIVTTNTYEKVSAPYRKLRLKQLTSVH